MVELKIVVLIGFVYYFFIFK